MAQPKQLPILVVQIEGAVKKTNVDAYRAAALEYVESITTDLQTDNDFAEAEAIVKWCNTAEKKLKQVKARAMEEAADINAVFSALDEISAALRDKRLQLNKLVKGQKEDRKREAVESAMKELSAHVEGLESSLDGLELPDPADQREDFIDATKGKRTLKSLRDGVNAALADVKRDYQEIYQKMFLNVATLRTYEQYRFLFSDAQDYATKNPGDFENLVKVRIAEHKESEKDRLNAEREKIREEERAKAEADVAARSEQGDSPPTANLEESAAPATDGELEVDSKMQTLMFALTQLAAEDGFTDFLDRCGVSESDYEEIKVVWREKLGVEPYC